MSEKEASNLSDELEKHFLGKVRHDKASSLWFEYGDKFLEVYISSDSSAWVFGGRITAEKPVLQNNV